MWSFHIQLWIGVEPSVPRWTGLPTGRVRLMILTGRARVGYPTACADRRAWRSKVRPGGLLGGHDYLDGIGSGSLYGV